MLQGGQSRQAYSRAIAQAANAGRRRADRFSGTTGRRHHRQRNPPAGPGGFQVAQRLATAQGADRHRTAKGQPRCALAGGYAA